MLNDFTICSYHGFCIENLKKLKKILNKQNTDNTIAINIICDTINDIRTAKKLGQRMENRMKLYRKNIEALGFERKYK